MDKHYREKPILVSISEIEKIFSKIYNYFVWTISLDLEIIKNEKLMFFMLIICIDNFIYTSHNYRTFCYEVCLNSLNDPNSCF